jgi:hypothetical protein
MQNTDNIAEKIVEEINQDFFLKEFTFSSNKLKGHNNDELADNIVWLDNILFLIQIKLRDTNSEGDAREEKKWFENKVIKKAKEQIKNTISYFRKYESLLLPNGRGFISDLKAAPVDEARKIILYHPGKNLPLEEKLKKMYFSKEIGSINLFQITDYQQICKHLSTPFEINEYLIHREEIFLKLGSAVDKFPEQLLLGHYLSGDSIEEINEGHLSYFHSFSHNPEEFDVSGLTSLFFERQTIPTPQYHLIIKELAKLHRSELKEFKKRFMLSIEKSKSDSYTLAYRMTIGRTECGFVFIPLPKELSSKWENALKNLTFAHQYDQHLEKCIGVTISSGAGGFLDINWLLLESAWQKDEVYEKELYANFPFRAVSMKRINRYHFNPES